MAKTQGQWWHPVSDALTHVQPRSIKVKCPACKEYGYAISRWLKGPQIKPLYVFHYKSGVLRSICELGESQAFTIRNNIKFSPKDLEKLLETRQGLVLFSGGKDSVATLVYINGIAKSVGKSVTAVFIDTTAGLPENVLYVKKVCKYLKVALKIVSPKVDYFTLLKQWGIPSFGKRWCCRELKIKPVADYIAKIKEPVVVFDGIRAEESRIREQYLPIWYHPGFKCLSVSPIFQWTKDEVLTYINSNGLPKTLLHQMSSSTECWCGAYKTEADFRKLYEIDKEMYKKLSRAEDQVKTGYTFLYKKGKRIKLKELAADIRSKK